MRRPPATTRRPILAQNPPADPRYRRWGDTYADPGFAALTARCAEMLDEAGGDNAEELFLTGMRHEIAFWDVPVDHR
ncbi:hypothetical protein ACWIGI_32555 [Nocardia sp. NPDC055321]